MKKTHELKAAAQAAINAYPEGSELQQCKVAFELLYGTPYSNDNRGLLSSIRYHVCNIRKGIVKQQRGGAREHTILRERNNRMLGLRQQGLSMQEIGDMFFISRAAVSAALKRHAARLEREKTRGCNHE